MHEHVCWVCLNIQSAPLQGKPKLVLFLIDSLFLPKIWNLVVNLILHHWEMGAEQRNMRNSQRCRVFILAGAVPPKVLWAVSQGRKVHKAQRQWDGLPGWDRICSQTTQQNDPNMFPQQGSQDLPSTPEKAPTFTSGSMSVFKLKAPLALVLLFWPLNFGM